MPFFYYSSGGRVDYIWWCYYKKYMPALQQINIAIPLSMYFSVAFIFVLLQYSNWMVSVGLYCWKQGSYKSWEWCKISLHAGDWQKLLSCLFARFDFNLKIRFNSWYYLGGISENEPYNLKLLPYLLSFFGYLFPNFLIALDSRSVMCRKKPLHYCSILECSGSTLAQMILVCHVCLHLLICPEAQLCAELCLGFRDKSQLP